MCWREAILRSHTISRMGEPVKELGSLLKWVFIALLGVVLYFALFGSPTASHLAHNLKSIREPLEGAARDGQELTTLFENTISQQED